MKKQISLILGTISAFLLLSGCWRQEVVAIRVEVTPLRSDVCAELILNRLDRIDGVESSTANPAEGWIEVTYNSTKIAKRNIEYVIAGLGFQANDFPGDPAAYANLPEACR